MAVAPKAATTLNMVRKWAFGVSVFHRYGLYFDDILYETDDVTEAVKRLPQKIVDERNYRQLRAAQCYIQKIYLPKEQWVTFEDDQTNRYLSPIVDQIMKERLEREEWDANH